MLELIGELESKDKVTIFISLLSFVVAATAFFHSLRSKKRETVRDARASFERYISETLTLKNKIEELRFSLGDAFADPGHAARKVSLFDQRELCIEKLRHLEAQGLFRPMPAEYLLLGAVLIETGRAAQSVPFYQKAYRLSINSDDKAAAQRVYGRALILSGDMRNGRQHLIHACRRFRILAETREYDESKMMFEAADCYRRMIFAEMYVGCFDNALGDFQALKVLTNEIRDEHRFEVARRALVLIERTIEERFRSASESGKSDVRAAEAAIEQTKENLERLQGVGDETKLFEIMPQPKI